jgi:putative ABC transport system permease protein
MIRGRLLAVNAQPLQLAKYTDERTRNLAEREFNLSWMVQLPADQPLLAGRAWQGAQPESGFSVEAGLAKTLGIQLGDRLSFDIAGTQIEAPVSSLRKVNWDNFRVNFFVISTPDLLQQQVSSWICSFYLPAQKQQWVSDVIQLLPNLSVIDVSLILREVQSIIERVIQAVQFVFVLTLLAGMIVLHAALAATQDERLQESAILRTLGASRRQILGVMLSEFALIGALAGLVALLGAMGLGWFVSVRLLELPYNPSLWLPLLAIGGGIALVLLVGWRSINQVLQVPPLQTLNQMG